MERKITIISVHLTALKHKKCRTYYLNPPPLTSAGRHTGFRILNSDSRMGLEPEFSKDESKCQPQKNKSIQEEKNKVGRKMNVGIDVGKARLDLFLHEINLCFSVENNPTGIRQAIKRLRQYRTDRIVIGATGRYEHDFVEAAIDRGLAIVIVNPLKVRRYAGAIGILAKTDQIDCRLIAQYAAVIQPEVRRQKINMKIKDLLVRRRQIIAMSTMEKNRFQVMPKFLKTDIKRLIQFLELKRKKIEQGLNTLIEKEDEWREKRQILLSMTGVGLAVAHTLSGDLPELGTPGHKQIARLCRHSF